MANHKLAAKFSKDENPRNGFGDPEFVADIVRERAGDGYAVVRWETLRVSDEIVDGTSIPTFRIFAAEPLSGDAAAQAKQLMDARYMERGNRQDLPQEGMFGVDMKIDGDQDGEEVDGDGKRVVPPPSLEERRAEKAEAAAKANGADA